jgi:hypothetical protein
MGLWHMRRVRGGLVLKTQSGNKVSCNNADTPQGAMLSITQCQSTRTDGQSCAAPTGQSGFCFWHDPERRHQMLEASRKGGSRKALPLPEVRPLDAEEARGLLASVLIAMLEGAVDPTSARAAAYILQVERKIAEGEETEKRLAALESFVHSDNGRA